MKACTKYFFLYQTLHNFSLMIYRKVNTEESAFHGIMSSLTGQNSFEYDKLRLHETIKGIKQSNGLFTP